MNTIRRVSLKAVATAFLPLLSALGLPTRLTGLNHYRTYRGQARPFERLFGRITHRFPILTDYAQEAGDAASGYFHQALLVASYVFERRPQRHIDVGSRVDGFVAHVAAFRDIKVFDVRPLSSAGHPNIKFIQADLMSPQQELPTVDSVSCLHAIEHFRLERYGNPIDPEGHKKGLDNLLKMVSTGSTLYISGPIGRQNEVHFNPHRVFSPTDILTWCPGMPAALVRFDYIDSARSAARDCRPTDIKMSTPYGLGTYTFSKRTA